MDTITIARKKFWPQFDMESCNSDSKVLTARFVRYLVFGKNDCFIMVIFSGSTSRGISMVTEHSERMFVILNEIPRLKFRRAEKEEDDSTTERNESRKVEDRRPFGEKVSLARFKDHTDDVRSKEPTRATSHVGHGEDRGWEVVGHFTSDRNISTSIESGEEAAEKEEEHDDLCVASNTWNQRQTDRCSETSCDTMDDVIKWMM